VAAGATYPQPATNAHPERHANRNFWLFQRCFFEIVASGYFENEQITLQYIADVFTQDAGFCLVSARKNACTGVSDIHLNLIWVL
jgi:hypothetical protein